MIALDRRTVLTAGAAGALATLLPASVAAATEPLPALFLYDPRFPRALVEAQDWQARGVRILDVREHDLGRAWRETVAPLLAGTRDPVFGRTLGSDRMISAIFAREHGLRLVEEAPASGEPRCETRAWRLVR
jgi:hypothetical protein